MTSPNGTGAATSVDVPIAAHSNGVGAWLERARQPLQLAPTAPDPVDFDPELLAEQRQELAHAHARAELQRDPVRLDLLSPEELRRQRRQVEHIRAMQDKLDVFRVTSDIAAETRDLRAKKRLAHVDARWRVWKARAAARRDRLMDPTSRMASIYRAQVVANFVLMALTTIGIVWCAIGVGDALGGEWFAYTIEPLFSVPLLVIMAMHGLAARNRTTFPGRGHDDRDATLWRGRPRRYWGLLALKLSLFTVTTVLNVAPVVPGLGHWRDTTTLLTHLFPPALIVLTVQLQPIVSAFLSRLLVSVYVEATEAVKRLHADDVALLTRVHQINDLWEAGRLRSANPNDRNDRSAGPSVASVMDALGIGKELCQAGVDGWHLVHGNPKP